MALRWIQKESKLALHFVTLFIADNVCLRFNNQYKLTKLKYVLQTVKSIKIERQNYSYHYQKMEIKKSNLKKTTLLGAEVQFCQVRRYEFHPYEKVIILPGKKVIYISFRINRCPVSI